MRRGEDLHVAIDAAIVPWLNGGVAHALVSLVSALSSLPDGDERYTLVVESDEQEVFWRSHLGPRLTLALNGPPRPRPWHTVRSLAGLGLVAGSHRDLWAHRIRRRALNLSPWPELPVSNGFYERLGCDVLHLTWQRYVVCAVPTVYNPHDLQHLRFPQFFTPRDLAWRDTMYPAGCRLAQAVIVGSHWAKQDIVRQFATHPSKIQVILEGADARTNNDVDDAGLQIVRDKYKLPARYLFYPAISWPHKNHLRLLDAAAMLRDEQHMTVPLVFTGGQRPDHWPRIEARIRELRLQEQVHALGFVSEDELRAVSRGATAMIQPSLFEASSLPIFDAWMNGVPVACSNTTALPEQVGDAGLLFEPTDARAIADAMSILMTRPDVLEKLRRLGSVRLARFDWGRAAKSYRAIYRRLAGRTLNDEDRHLLDEVEGPPGAPPS